MIGSSQAFAALSAAFLASLVEAVEAMTIVLAVGIVRGWRPALMGAGGALALLVVLVLALGPLLGTMPLHALQLAIGTLLLLFGVRWLRKAILRAAGVIALHDEDSAYAEETALLRSEMAPRIARVDAVALATAFKAVMLEGVEIVFIVVAVGAVGGNMLPAGLGAAAACLLVVLAGMIVHRPLARVPENTLKFAVGVMLSSFGVFWVGEGLGFAWPGQDLAIPGIAAAFLATALAGVTAARRRRQGAAP